MVNSRNKGATFERNVARELHLLLGVTFKRDLDQYRQSDRGDLIPDDEDFPFLIECKAFGKPLTTCKPEWWDQARKAAQNAGKRPCVIWKSNHRPVRVTMSSRDVIECIARGHWSAHHHLIDTTLEGFAYVAREGFCVT